MEKYNVSQIEGRLFGLRDYAVTSFADDDSDFDAFASADIDPPQDDDRVSDDVDDILRDFVNPLERWDD